MSKKNKNKHCPYYSHPEYCSIYGVQLPCLKKDMRPFSYSWKECIRIKYHLATETIPQKQTQEEWDVDLQEIKQCPHTPKVKVEFGENILGKLFSLIISHSKTEWLGYLIGTEEESEGSINIKISDVYIPEQEVTASSVRVLEKVNCNGIVGVIHSHCNMGVFHSGTDDEYLIGNHNLSIVTNNKLEFIGKYRYFPKCNSVRNRYFIVNVDITSSESKNYSSKIKIKENQNAYPYLKQYTFDSNTDIGY